MPVASPMVTAPAPAFMVNPAAPRVSVLLANDPGEPPSSVVAPEFKKVRPRADVPPPK